jgi:glycosyltransferase involved in cell wall biosynthesis
VATAPRVFASLDSFLPPVPGRPLPGRGVANHQFLKALMRHGRFDAYHFFLPTADELRSFRSTYGAVAPGGAPISSLPRRALLARVRSTDYTVFHLADHASGFQPLCCLRNERATRPFPVTALSHSVSEPSAMSAYLAMGLQGPRSHDAILCASDSGRQVMQVSFDSLVASTRDRISPPLAFPMRLPVIPIGVDADALTAGDRLRGRAMLELGVDRVVVLYVGRFSAHEKMDLFPLLHAFARARSRPEGASLELVLAGSRQGSPYADMLGLFAQALDVRPHVHLISDFNEDAKADLYAAADLFVSPCDNPQETFGLTVVEAMAAGLPVVVSDYDGYRETVPADSGVFVPTYTAGTTSELADLAFLSERRSTHLRLGQGVALDLAVLERAMLELAGDPARREALGRAGAEFARRTYDWARLIPRYEALWDELNAAARDASPGNVHRPNRLRMDFGAVFAHYPTRTLAADDRLRATELGVSFLEVRRYPVYPEMAPVLKLRHVVGVVRAAAEGASYADLVASLADDLNEDRARQVIVWALKHGMLELD